MKHHHIILYLFLMFFCMFLINPVIYADNEGVPFTFNLEESGYVTLVVEDTNGRRVRNFISEEYFEAGEHTVYWDGYEEVKIDSNYIIHQEPASAGEYILRGLVHQGIDMRYEFSVYSPGDPPWVTRDRTGGWMGDHTAPAGIAYLPSGEGNRRSEEPQMIISCAVAERGYAVIWTDLEGNKIYGTDHDWDGGRDLTVDIGSDAIDHFMAYTAAVRSAGVKIYGLSGFGGMNEIFRIHLEDGWATMDEWNDIGFAVYNGIAVLTHGAKGKIIVIDLKDREEINRINIEEPLGVTFVNEEKLLLGLREGKIMQYKIDLKTGVLSNEKVFIEEELEQPHRIYMSEKETLFVSDHGLSHQVKVFDHEGKYIRSIGEPGGAQIGEYNELQMNRPMGVAIDKKGVLWVTEHDQTPKRISLWDAETGEFIRAIYGGPQYGSGGMIDPLDKNRLYYSNSMELTTTGMGFELDWKTGESKLDNIYIRTSPAFYGGDMDRIHVTTWPEMNKVPREKKYYPMDKDRYRGDPPEYAIYLNDNKYMTNHFNAGSRLNSGNTIFMEDEDGLVWPVAIVTSAESFVMESQAWGQWVKDYDEIYEKHLQDIDRSSHIIVWSDINFDRHIREDEIKLIERERAKRLPITRVHFHDDLAAVVGLGGYLPAPKFTEEGVPVYDVSGFEEKLPVEPYKIMNIDSVRGDDPLLSDSGWFIQRIAESRGGYISGFNEKNNIWYYYAYGLEYRPRKKGEMTQPTRFMGPVLNPETGEAKEVFTVSGEKGSVYLMTTDGLFLSELASDSRIAGRINLQEEKRGTIIKDITFTDEHFHPTIIQTVDDEIYMTGGHEFIGLFSIEGWESVKRISPEKVRLTREKLASPVKIIYPETEEKLEPWNSINIKAKVTCSFIKKVEFYVNNNYIGEAENDGNIWKKNWQNVAPGNYLIEARAIDNKGISYLSGPFKISIEVPEGPYTGDPFQIPGEIDAELFDGGGQQVGHFRPEPVAQEFKGFFRDEEVIIKPTDDFMSDYKVARLADGEWFKYTIDVEKDGLYNINVRIASPVAGGSFNIYVDDKDLTGKIVVPYTGGSEEWQEITIEKRQLNKGKQIMKFVTETGGFDLNYIRITKSR